MLGGAGGLLKGRVAESPSSMTLRAVTSCEDGDSGNGIRNRGPTPGHLSGFSHLGAGPHRVTDFNLLNLGAWTLTTRPTRVICHRSRGKYLLHTGKCVGEKKNQVKSAKSQECINQEEKLTRLNSLKFLKEEMMFLFYLQRK